MRKLHWVSHLIDRRLQQPELCRHQTCPGILSACMLAVLLLLTGPALAQTEWTGVTNNNWFFAGNWSPEEVPIQSDVDIDIVDPNVTLVYEQATGTLDLLRVGVFDEGELWVRNGGSIESLDGFIGIEPDSLGSVWVDGAGSSWGVSSRIRVGDRGEGFLSIINGGKVTSSVSTVGLSADSFGGVLVSGEDSQWMSGTQLVIGWSGGGILIADQGGEVTNQNAWVGQNEGALGMVFVEGAGSRWDSGGFLTVGQGGAVGAFWVIEGAELESADARIGVLDGIGLMILDDAGSSWINTGGLEVGPSGGGYVFVGSGTLLDVGGEVGAGGQASTYGDLIINGTLQANDGVSVREKGWLGGTGTVNALVTVEDGGTLAPGESAGTLSMGTLVLQEGARLEFDLDAPGTVGLGVNDLVAVSGDLTLDGVIDVVDLGGFGVGAYTLFTYTGALTDNGLTVGTLPDGFMAEVDTTVTGQVRLIVTSERIFKDRFEMQEGSATDIVEPLPRIEFVTDRTVLFEAVGQFAELLVVVLDESGEEIQDASVSWTSSDPTVLSIEPTGPLSAQITRLGNFTGTLTVTAQHDDSQLQAQAFVAHAVLTEGTVYLPSIGVSADPGVAGKRGIEPLVLDIRGDRFAAHEIVLTRTPETEAIVAGDILLTGDLAGIMVEVMAVSTFADRVELQVEPATFTQAFEELDFDAEQDFLEVTFDSLGDDTLMTVRSVPDGGIVESRLLRNLNLLDRLNCEGDLEKEQDFDVSRLSFTSSLKAQLRLHISNRQLDTLFFDVSGELKAFAGASLEIEATLTAQSGCTVDLPNIRSPSFPMGPLSFEVELDPQLFLSAVAMAQGNINASTPTLEMVLTGNARLSYIPGSGWETSGGFGFNKESDPDFSLTASAGMGVGATTGLMANAQLNILLGRRFFLSTRLLSANFLEFSSALGGGFSVGASSSNPSIDPSSPNYGGPSSSLSYHIDISGKLEVDILSGTLGKFLELSMTADEEWTIFELEGDIHESAEINGLVQCVQACSSVPNDGSEPVTVLINAEVLDGMPNTGIAEVWLQQDDSSSLQFLSSLALNDGSAQMQIVPDQNFPLGTHTVHVRVRLDGPFNAYTAIWPLAPSPTPSVGAFTVNETVMN